MTKRLTRLAAFFIAAVFYIFTASAQQKITPETALKSYLNNGDTSFHWELKDTFNIGSVKGYNLLLTSQKWRTSVWTHQLTIFVPAEVSHDGALLFITGGSIKNGLPNWSGPADKVFDGIAKIAGDNKAIAAVLRQTPNQPLYGNLTEDALISYTLHNFKNDGDYSWPLLFPMVKGAVRAMDAVQAFARENLKKNVSNFVVSGASKRGWTTWLTGANDKRVIGIVPMVIDVLNMPVSLDYQIKTWKEYSVQIEDYVKLGIPQAAHTESGTAITTMVDPYSYRKSLDIPKMLIMGTNDPYWVVDNVKNFIDSVPGKYLLNYVPNAGHDLGDGKQAFEGLSAFFGITIGNKKYPENKWKATENGKQATLSITATGKSLVDVILWSTSSEDLDFRNEKWTSKSLGISQQSKFNVTKPFPQTGYGAFYVDLKYKDDKGGTYLVSTRVYTTDNSKIL